MCSPDLASALAQAQTQGQSQAPRPKSFTPPPAWGPIPHRNVPLFNQQPGQVGPSSPPPSSPPFTPPTNPVIPQDPPPPGSNPLAPPAGGGGGPGLIGTLPGGSSTPPPTSTGLLGSAPGATPPSQADLATIASMRPANISPATWSMLTSGQSLAQIQASLQPAAQGFGPFPK